MLILLMKVDSLSVDSVKTYEIPEIVDFQDGLDTTAEATPLFYEKSITDMLIEFPLVQFSYGVDQTIFITNKGRKPSYTGIYLNGHRLPDDLTGYFNVTKLPLHILDRVQTSRTVAGAELSGVNLISRLNRYEKPYSYVDFMIGSYGSNRYVLALTRALTNDLGFYLSGSYYKSDGFRNNGDAERSAIYSNIYYNRFLPIRLDFFYVNNDYGMPGSVLTPVDGRQKEKWFDISGTYSYKNSVVTVYYDYQDIEYVDTLYGTAFRCKLKQTGAMIAERHRILGIDLSFGANGLLTWMNGEWVSMTSWTEFVTGGGRGEYWAGLYKSLGRAFVRATGKVDYESGRETFYCPKLEAGVKITGPTYLNVTVSRDVHAPSTWELYAPFDTLNPYLRVHGNWDLLPEYCWTKEVGLRSSNFLLSFYRLDFTDYITAAQFLSWPNIQYINWSTWETSGIEGFVRYPIRIYNADSSVMTEFILGLSGNSFFRGDSVPYVPDYNAGAFISFGRATEKLSLGLALEGEFWGTRYDIFDEALDGFNVFSVAGLVKFISLSCVARVNNVFDTEYERTPYYPMPVRNFDVSIKWEFWD